MFSLADRRGFRSSTFLDPRNRDPNHLLTTEVAENYWFKTMLNTAQCWRQSLGEDAATLHVDVHGCRDPPHTPSHLTVGLGAMMTYAEKSGLADKVARVFNFGQALEVELTAVVTSMHLSPQVQPVRVIVPSDLNTHSRFAGAWPPDTQRHTQTQQAVSFAAFEYSVQLELSKTLRRALLQNTAALAEFGGALMAALERAKQFEGVAPVG